MNRKQPPPRTGRRRFPTILLTFLSIERKWTSFFAYREIIVTVSIEFNRLYTLFEEVDSFAAKEWLAFVQESDLVDEVHHLADAYKKQNEAIHHHCAACKSTIDCPLEQREEDWFRSGDLERFSFESCGLYGHVSEGAWNAFAFLLTASEHATERAKSLGHTPSLGELWDNHCARWHARLAVRFHTVRS